MTDQPRLSLVVSCHSCVNLVSREPWAAVGVAARYKLNPSRVVQSFDYGCRDSDVWDSS